MRYYAVADTHGYYSILERALKEVGFFEDKEPSKLIVCGDLLDRGAEAKALVDFCLRLAEQDRLIYLLGNHEDLLVQCLQQIARGGAYEIAAGMSHHYSNGTWDTLLQLAEMGEVEAYQNPHELVRRVMRSPFYSRLLPKGIDFFETPHHIFTHGWLPCLKDGIGPLTKYAYDPDWRAADISRWQSARWYNGMELACLHRVTEPGKTVVCGHWHASYGHAKIAHRCTEWGKDAIFSPFDAEGILAIDACTAASGRINCVVIED